MLSTFNARENAMMETRDDTEFGHRTEAEDGRNGDAFDYMDEEWD